MKKRPDYYYYPAVFAFEPDQEISVVFPDLDVATSGESIKDALVSARECLGLALFGLEEDGDPIPPPSDLYQIPLQENERVMLIDVFMPSLRLSNVNKAVNRTVTLPAWLNASAQEKNINVSQLLQKALKEQLS